MALLLVLAALVLTPHDNGRTVVVAPQTKVKVVLPSNASTGYRWRLAARPDGHVLKLVSHTYVAPMTSRVGAAGKEIWRFRTVGVGTARLRMVYVQSGSKRIGRRFGVRLTVKTPPPPA